MSLWPFHRKRPFIFSWTPRSVPACIPATGPELLILDLAASPVVCCAGVNVFFSALADCLRSRFRGQRSSASPARRIAHNCLKTGCAEKICLEDQCTNTHAPRFEDCLECRVGELYFGCPCTFKDNQKQCEQELVTTTNNNNHSNHDYFISPRTIGRLCYGQV